MKIVLFDGDCHFCDASVQFIIKRDRNKNFKFASIQSEIGQSLIEQFHIPKSLDSVIYIEETKCYVKSTAVLRITKKLDGGWKCFYPLIFIPAFMRNIIYDLVAKNRHKLRKQKVCKIPTKEDLERFLH
ncbi:MAG TPA: DUF393 domain-containing protein [Ureibacillus sp.]|nr:DUF393 domain-containing protein [Ureibacillus sp.]